MKQRTYESLGIDIAIPVPESVDEFNLNAWAHIKEGSPKAENPCLDEATNNVVYRSYLAVWRDLFLHGRDANPEKNITEFKGVEQITGIKRKVETNAKNEIVGYDESEKKYFVRVCAELKRTPASFQELANAARDLIPFDASASERGSGLPRKTAKEYLEAADQILAKGEPVAAAVAKKLAALIGHDVELEDGKLTRETLGKAISENEAIKRAAAKAKLAGELLADVAV